MDSTCSAVADALKGIKDLSESLEASQLLNSDDNERRVSLISEVLNQDPSKGVLLKVALEKLQASLDRLNSYKTAISDLLNSPALNISEQGQNLDSKTPKKSSSVEKKVSSQAKKFKKKIGNNSSIINVEIHKGYFSSLLEIVNSQNFQIDHNSYRKLVISTFDLLPAVSQKISHDTVSKEVNVGVLSLIWKLITFPKSSVFFSDQQRLVGLPELVPLKYGIDGPLYRTDKKFAIKKGAVKKGLFSFTEDVVHSEVIRFCKKIYDNSSKYLVMLANSSNASKHKKDEFGESSIKDLIKEIKNNLQSKISLFKVNYLSFLIMCYMENSKFEIHLLNSREIKDEYFDRSIQSDYIKEWERQMLNNLV